MMATVTRSDSASRAAKDSGTTAAQNRTISTPRDHAATADAPIQGRRPAGPAVTALCSLRSPTKRNATPGSFRERYRSAQVEHRAPVSWQSCVDDDQPDP